MGMSGEIAHFSPFSFEPRTGELRKDGHRVKLHPQGAKILSLLIKAEGETVTRDEIRKGVWSDDTFVDYELGINSGVRQIRAALGDDSEDPKYVETVPRVGYRFVAKLVAAASEEPSTSAAPTGFLPAAGLAALLVLAVGAYWLSRSDAVDTLSGPIVATFTRITSDAGREIYPSLSPDGGFVVYASRASGVLDIYRKRIGGETRFNLTANSGSDDSQPAFSPDGEQIAFRSERDGGGIFIMGATGESVRRVTDSGFNPAWSPDGRRLVVAPLRFLNPIHGPVGKDRALRIIYLATGQESIAAEGRFLQPSWSPDGHRIAYWTIQNGQRDIWTVDVETGEMLKLTDDAALDWNPVWSPVEPYLYFSSDRAGSFNLWRLHIDETHGERVGAPEPVTTPSSYAGYLSISGDGRRIAYASIEPRGNIFKLPFDPVGHVVTGEPVALTRGSLFLMAPDVSPHGEVAAHSAITQEDIYVISADGEHMRQVTDDAHRDRFARWSPDGGRIAFYSNRSGSYEIWWVNKDGSGLHQLTKHPEGTRLSNPVWSPDGATMAYSGSVASYLLDIDSGVESIPESWHRENEHGVTFMPKSWSDDGRWLAGHFRSDAGEYGLAVYSLDTHELERLSKVGTYPAWLSDNRHLVFHAGEYLQARLMIFDRETGDTRELLAPVDAGAMYPSVSQDERTIYFQRFSSESDIWLLNLEDES